MISIMKNYILLILVLGLTSSACAVRCHSNVERKSNMLALVCEDVRLIRDFGSTVENYTVSLLLTNTILNDVPKYAFLNFAVLQQLYLNHTEIKTVVPGSFNGLEKLEELYLEDNMIESIPDETFGNLISLRMLDLSRNNITKVQYISLNGLTHLEELRIAKNNISEINENQFASVKTLRSLDLAHNKIASLDEAAFMNLPALERLLINDNLLEELPNDVFEHTKLLRILDVSDNNFLSIEFSKLPPSLEQFFAIGVNVHQTINLDANEIDSEVNVAEVMKIRNAINKLSLSNNALETLGDYAFPNVVALEYLDLSYNSISEVGEYAFRNLENLKTLSLTNNKLRHLPVGCFKHQHHLLVLKLSANNISALEEYGTFFGLVNLRELYLDNNILRYINEKTLYVLQSLEQINLTNNALQTLDPHQLLNQVPTLSVISLNHNPWECESLLDIFTTFTTSPRRIYNGTNYDAENVNGITCHNADKMSPDPFKNSFSEEVPENLRMKNSDRSFKNSPLLRFLEKDFTNSTFFKFFNSNFFDNNWPKGFRKTYFYKYFDNDFMNSSFVQYLNNNFQKKGVDENRNNENNAIKEVSSEVINFTEDNNVETTSMSTTDISKSESTTYSETEMYVSSTENGILSYIFG